MFNLFKRRRCLRASFGLLVCLVSFSVPTYLLNLNYTSAWSFYNGHDGKPMGYTSVLSLYNGHDGIPMSYSIQHPSTVGLTATSASMEYIQQVCVHPRLQLWHPRMQPYFRKPASPKCAKSERNWVFTSNGTFYISETAVKSHGGHVNCKMVPILRSLDDFTLKEQKSIKSVQNGSLLVSDVMKVRCVARDGKTSTMVLSGVAPKPEVRERAASVKSLPESALGLDVFMFGFDSVSRLTWIRNLPKTYKYFVEELGGVVMEGYNIVGDGTPQALLPILTGQTEVELPEARRGFSGANTVDNHPWIFKDFSKLGYATQWGEDEPKTGVFTYRMLGFREQPTDHYLRPFYLEAQKHYTRYRSLCLGSMPRHLIVMNYMRDFVNVYSPQRKFSLIFHGEYSHGSDSKLQLADEDLLKLLRDLKTGGHLDNALLILFSDHGARFNWWRTTEQGKHEERLPFVGLRVPEKIVSAHPEIGKNLRTNAGRLSTPFDIHATFRDVIDYGGDKSDVSEDITKPLPRGISLFKEIPKRRSCADAAIEPHWCGCLTWVVVPPSDPLVIRAVFAVLTKINLELSRELDLCQQLELFEILEAVRYSTSDKMLKFEGSSDRHGRVPKFSRTMKKSEELYQVTFHTRPGGGIFEATVRHLILEDRLVLELSSVSRINKYGEQSHCLAAGLPHLRQYCYCRVQPQHQPRATQNNRVQQQAGVNVTLGTTQNNKGLLQDGVNVTLDTAQDNRVQQQAGVNVTLGTTQNNSGLLQAGVNVTLGTKQTNRVQQQARVDVTLGTTPHISSNKALKHDEVTET